MMQSSYKTADVCMRAADIGKTIEAVSRFSDSAPRALIGPVAEFEAHAGIWHHSMLERSFDGHRHHVVAIHLGGTTDCEQILSGRLAWQRMLAGGAIVTPVGQSSEWRLRGQVDLLHIYLDPSALAGHVGASEVAPAKHTLRPFRDPVLEHLARALRASILERGAGGVLAEMTLRVLVARLLEKHFVVDGRAPIHRSYIKGGLTWELQERLESFVREHASESIGMAELARLTGLSVGHFTRAFRATYGISPYQYLLQRRLQEAVSLLKGSSMCIADIARATGFSTASHFAVRFQKAMGCSPRDYRRSNELAL